MTALTPEAVRAILDGCEGVTPGPWGYVLCDDNRPMIATDGDVICHPDYNHGSNGNLPDHMDVTNFTYIARLDPATVAALCSDNLAMREALEDIAVFVESHFVEGDKEYQSAIVARAALEVKP